MFGFGSGEVTTLPSGFITYYFRKTFSVSDISGAADPVGLFSFVSDDGAAIFLNGARIGRRNLVIPTVGNLSATTLAGTATVHATERYLCWHP